MLGNIVLLVTLLAYSIIVSQSFMYMLCLKNVQLKLEAGSYTELRKLINAGMTGNFSYVVYAALLSTLALVIITIKNPGSLQFITAAIAFVALIADTLLTVKGNMPLNNQVDSWAPGNYPANWADYRTKWFHVFKYRQLANIMGFVSLLVGTVFGSSFS